MVGIYLNLNLSTYMCVYTYIHRFIHLSLSLQYQLNATSKYIVGMLLLSPLAVSAGKYFCSLPPTSPTHRSVYWPLNFSALLNYATRFNVGYFVDINKTFCTVETDIILLIATYVHVQFQNSQVTFWYVLNVCIYP